MLEREIQMKLTLDEGDYVLVPLTTGALLQRPMNAKDEEIQARVKFEDITMPHPYFLTTLNDMFRKIDLALNGSLSAQELNQFGKIVGQRKFEKITQQDFTKKEEFKSLSCGKDGLTNLGFKQYLFRNFNQEQINQMLTNMGYDKGLYSYKSRVFVVSFQADIPLDVKINETVMGNLHTRALDLYMCNQLTQHTPKDMVHKSDYLFFKVDHEKSYGCSYGIANKTEKYLKIELDMTESSSSYFSPKDGTSAVIVPPKSIKYVGSTVSNPDSEEILFMRDFEVEEIDPPSDIEDEEEVEDEESEDEDESEQDDA